MSTVMVDERDIAGLLPFYVVACLDRINIGFAACSMTGEGGDNKELAITSMQFGFLTGVFIERYFLFDGRPFMALPVGTKTLRSRRET